MLGVHFAITSEQGRSLLAADDGDEVGELLEDIEESWDDDASKVDTDKAWDAIHRCLTDGTLDPEGGVYPLSHAVLGGRHLDDDYYVVYVSAAKVRDVAEALRTVDRTWLRRRFDAIDDRDYDGAHDDEDFEYTWRNFVDVKAFYDRAAAAERAVIFTAT
ncbi:YfbM family protein [Micromonospora sp. NPDC049891]|uniref:YfbM family protein n=1 Tax=Micromonospora sp. NPDC049891 TaxID=3155655 RepID=UPI0033DDFE60